MNRKSKFENNIKYDKISDFSGVSMKPLLRQGRDFVMLEKFDGRQLKKYEVPLCRVDYRDEKVLHRIVKIHDGKYVTRGDNCVTNDPEVTGDNIEYVMTGFIRDGKMTGVSNPWYRLYTVLWVNSFPIRKPLMKARRRIKKLVRGLMKQ